LRQPGSTVELVSLLGLFSKVRPSIAVIQRKMREIHKLPEDSWTSAYSCLV